MTDLVELCLVCQKVKFKYTCPRCNIRYCSVACYRAQKHLKCSEEFYKDCIHEKLTKQQPSSSMDVRKIYEILKRMSKPDEELQSEYCGDGLNKPLDSDDETGEPDVFFDDEVEEEISERLKGIDLNDTDEVWQRLTPSEQNHFKQLVECGDIMKLLPDYKPWWSKRRNSKIIDLSVQQSNDATVLGVPKIALNIPEFGDICKKTPSTCLHFNLWNILAAYSCTVRFFVGEQLTNPWEATVYLLNISATLKYNTNFEDAEDAIVSVEMEALTTAGTRTKSDAASGADLSVLESRERLQQDARQLMGLRQYKLAALSDILKLLELARRHVKFIKQEDVKLQKLLSMCSGNIELGRNKLHQLSKKIEFLLSYVMQD